jgi:hypothetical protein
VVSASGYRDATAGTTALALLAENRYASAANDQSFAKLRAAWLEGPADPAIPGVDFARPPVIDRRFGLLQRRAWLALAVYSDLYREDARTVAELVDLEAR